MTSPPSPNISPLSPLAPIDNLTIHRESKGYSSNQGTPPVITKRELNHAITGLLRFTMQPVTIPNLREQV